MNEKITKLVEYLNECIKRASAGEYESLHNCMGLRFNLGFADNFGVEKGDWDIKSIDGQGRSSSITRNLEFADEITKLVDDLAKFGAETIEGLFLVELNKIGFEKLKLEKTRHSEDRLSWTTSLECRFS